MSSVTPKCFPILCSESSLHFIKYLGIIIFFIVCATIKKKKYTFYLVLLWTVNKKTKVSSLNDCPKATDGVTASFRIKTKKLIIPLLIF